jgi:hypothetical protein
MEIHPTGHTHRVVFVVDHGQPTAVPPKLLVHSGDEILFRSVDAGPVSLVFPNGILAGMPGGVPVNDITVAKTGVDVRLYVVLDEGRHPGAYAYTAFCRREGIDDAAVGASQPRIIIYE